MNRHINNAACIAAMLAAAWMLTGCQTPTKPATLSVNYYLAPPEKLSTVSTVAFVELFINGPASNIAVETTEELSVAMRQHRLFNVKVVRPSDPRYARVPTDCATQLDYTQIAQLHRELGCDAILIGTITTFQPYPRMRLGLQLRMLDLRTGETIWAVDQVWDGSEQRVEERIKKFYRCRMRDDFEPLGWRLALASPRAFEKFVAYETACTLPQNGDAVGDEDKNKDIEINLSEL